VAPAEKVGGCFTIASASRRANDVRATHPSIESTRDGELSVPMKRNPLIRFLICSAAAAVLLSRPTAAQWPQFRGPGSAGVAADATPPVRIGPTEGVLWKVEVPWSPSSPSIWAERIFLTTFTDGELQTRCHDRGDGRLLWAAGVKPEQLEVFHRSDGSPAAATPATDGQRVVSYFGSFGIICYDVDGKELWRRPLPVAISGGGFGSGTSPVIAGKRVLINRDQDGGGSSLLAIDLETGNTSWETQRPAHRGSFGTPMVWKNDGVDEVVLAGSQRINGYDLQTGEERWVVNGVSGFVCTTPVAGDGMLFFAAWSPGKADSPWPPWAAFLGQHDQNGDGEIALDEFDAGSRDFSRGLDLNHDGKITEGDWDVLLEGAAKSQNLLLGIKPGGRGDISETHVAWKFSRGLPYVPSPLFYDGRIY
jgi:outer membrane protein assembly factor BamB